MLLSILRAWPEAVLGPDVHHPHAHLLPVQQLQGVPVCGAVWAGIKEGH